MKNGAQAPDLDFSNVAAGSRKAELTVAELGPAAPGSRKRKLMQQLAEAERSKKPRAPGEDATSALMQKALQRASGEKVHDNTTKLRRALKTIEQKKAKSAHKWQERTETVRKEKEEAQDKKAANLKTKRQRGKKDFKASQKEKQGRAGFEGKHKGRGYLNKEWRDPPGPPGKA